MHPQVTSEITNNSLHLLLEQAIATFDNLDVTEATRKDYKYRIGLFITFINKNGFDVNSFLEFKRWLAARNDITVATKNKYLAAARVMLKELNRTGALPMDITQNVKSFGQNKKHKRDGVNDNEVIQIVEQLRGLDNTPKNPRLRAIFCLLALQGLRQVELVRLDVKDLELNRGIAHVWGKGRDDKEPISLHPTTIEALKSYLKANKIADGALFISGSNRSKNQRLTTRAIHRYVNDMFTELQIEKTPHGFRHYFTTTLIKNYKGDLLEVARYTRHRSVEMLQVYNDNINAEADLPRFYKSFEKVAF
jgi:integrase/recombinase XerC